jgi:hypothetical protein
MLKNKHENSVKILSKDLRSGVRPLRAEGVAADSFPLAAKLPFRLGMAAAVGADCSGPLVVGISAVPDSGIGRVMEVRRTLDFCTWKMIFEQKNKTEILSSLGSKNYHKHVGVTYRILTATDTVQVRYVHTGPSLENKYSVVEDGISVVFCTEMRQ